MVISRDHCSTLCLILVMIHVHIIRVRSIRCKELMCSEAQIEWQILWYPILLKIFGIWMYCGVESDQEYLEKLVEQIMGKLGSQYSEDFSFRTLLLSKPNSVHGTWGHIDVSCSAVCNQVDYTNVTRLNHTKSMMLVNSQFPGPPITAHDGDTIVVRVTSLVQPNITIHW